jgi:myo-inositol-1(or 4)-monophosphatase
VAAGILLIREAGGFATDLQGGEAVPETAHLVAGNEAIHRQLLSVLREGGGVSG